MEDGVTRRLCDLEQRLEPDNDGGCGEDAGGQAGEAPRDVTLADEAEHPGPGLGGHNQLSPEPAHILNRKMTSIAICDELQKHTHY